MCDAEHAQELDKKVRLLVLKSAPQEEISKAAVEAHIFERDMYIRAEKGYGLCCGGGC